MKHLLLTTIAAVVLVGCGESQQPAPQPIVEAARPEPPAAKFSDIDIHEAVEAGDIEAIKQYLAAGNDVNKNNVVTRPHYIMRVLAAAKRLSSCL